MEQVQVRIEGHSADLKELQRFLVDDEEVAGEVVVQPLSSISPGELREPVVVALVIGVAPIAIRNLRQALDRYMQHRETMEALRIYKDGVLLRGAEDLAPEGQ